MAARHRHVFTRDFIVTLRGLVGVHQSIYPETPPQGIYFEDLVRAAFRRIKKPVTIIEAGGKNQPRHDLLVEDTKISLKTETGDSTKPNHITITKLCTTEREPWEARVLIRRVIEHLSRYDVVFMLRAVWEPQAIRYQLVEIPVAKLRLIRAAKLAPAGHRKGRQSLGADITEKGMKIFRVHFDASDGKCSIRGLGVQHCALLDEWEVRR